MMTNQDFSDHLSALQLTPGDAAQLLGVSERSVRRWMEGEAVPGPTEAAVRAWKRLHDRHLPWKPDSISILYDDQDQLRRIREHDQLLDTFLREVEAGGVPNTPWAVDLAKGRATLGPAEISFYRLQSGGFSPHGYRRVDRTPTEDDKSEIRDGVYCIAQAIGRARAANEAILDVAEFTRKHAHSYVRVGPVLPNQSETARHVAMITRLADKLNELAGSSLDGAATYAQFEAILGELHRLNFFPASPLVSAVARVLIGPLGLYGGIQFEQVGESRT